MVERINSHEFWPLYAITYETHTHTHTFNVKRYESKGCSQKPNRSLPPPRSINLCKGTSQVRALKPEVMAIHYLGADNARKMLLSFLSFLFLKPEGHSGVKPGCEQERVPAGFLSLGHPQGCFQNPRLGRNLGPSGETHTSITEEWKVWCGRSSGHERWEMIGLTLPSGQFLGRYWKPAPAPPAAAADHPARQHILGR